MGDMVPLDVVINKVIQTAYQELQRNVDVYVTQPHACRAPLPHLNGSGACLTEPSRLSLCRGRWEGRLCP